MPVEIRVPEMGESVVDATVGKWLKKEGDAVKIGEALVGLETDKVNVEVTADQAGVVSKILHKEGDTVGVGDVLAVIAEGAAAAAAPAAPAAAAPAAATPAPAAQAAPAAAAPAAAPAASGVSVAAQPSEQGTNGAGKATPVAANVASKLGVDLSQVAGTGPGGQVTQDDVYAAARQRSAAPAPAARVAAAGEGFDGLGPATDRPLDPRGEKREPLSRLRQTIARRLWKAKHDTAMLTTFNEIDMTAVMDLRRRRQEEFQKRNGVRLGFMSFFTKAVVGALKAFPAMNSEIDGSDVITKNYYDIGMAVGTPRGLVVPVIRNADKMTFAEIEKAIGDIAAKARDGKLTLEDLQGGTFTISNGGVYGSLNSTPILNPPQVGILGLHKIEERPVVIKGEIVIRNMMYVAVSYDHRVVDGEGSVRFLVRVKELMEDPEQLLLEG